MSYQDEREQLLKIVQQAYKVDFNQDVCREY